MYHANAANMVSSDQALDRVWQRAQQLAAKGAFSGLQFVDDPGSKVPASTCFTSVDGRKTAWSSSTLDVGPSSTERIWPRATTSTSPSV